MPAVTQIYLSHASQDVAQVEVLYDRLLRAGYKPWMYKRNIQGGMKWRDVTRQAIHQSDLFLALLVYFIIINIGFFSFLLPGLFVAVLFSMFFPFIVIDRLSIYASFERSMRIVWGHWWQTFLVLTIPYAVIFFVRRLTKLTTWLGEWIIAGDIILLSFLMPYFFCVLLIQFNNLKSKAVD